MLTTAFQGAYAGLRAPAYWLPAACWEAWEVLYINSSFSLITSKSYQMIILQIIMRNLK